MATYFDNAATTRLDPAVLEKMRPYLLDRYGNAASTHSFGQAAEKAVDEARDTIAAFLGCRSSEVIFTSGATESNNLAIRGVFQAWHEEKPHFITTSIEHPSVLEVFKELEAAGADVTFIDPDSDGAVRATDVLAAVRDNTVLVSVMYVNNETGAVQPVGEIGREVKKIGNKRGTALPLYFHIDAVQAAAHQKINVSDLNCDLLSLSAHKIHGPKGIGCLYISSGTRLQPLFGGGDQEQTIRPGTLNVPGIIGFAAAVQLLNTEKTAQVIELRKQLVTGLRDMDGASINGGPTAPHIVNVGFAGLDNQALMMALDLAGFAVSIGSACAAGSSDPSYVLQAMKVSDSIIKGSLRVSLSRFNTTEEVEQLLEVLRTTVQKMKK